MTATPYSEEQLVELPAIGLFEEMGWPIASGSDGTRGQCSFSFSHGLQMSSASAGALLKGMEVMEADEVWCADITYIPMQRGFAYLLAVMDWRCWAVVSWKLSNTLEGLFRVEAFSEAVNRAGCVPWIFNTD